MKHIFNFILGVSLSIIVFSCAERAVCPAYQSAFIHDKETLDKRFSYFGEDSLPKNQLTASKNKFLVIERVPYKKKVRSFNTVPMKTVYPVLDDSTALSGDVQMLAEMDVVDSVALDSAVQYELPWKEKFNVEQEFYFHYFNDILVYPEERAQAKLDKGGKNKKNDKASKSDQPFFKRIFGGMFKKNEKNTSELTDDEVEEEREEEQETTKKNGLFGKKDKSNQEVDNELDSEEKTEDPPIDDSSDNEDDDF